MTADEIRTLIATLGLSQVGLARYLDAGDRTVRHWCLDKPIPEAVSMLLRYMAVTGVAPEQFKAVADRWQMPDPNKPAP